MKIGKIFSKGPTYGKYRPEYDSGRASHEVEYYCGPGARYSDFVTPQGSYDAENQVITCRTCKKFKLPFGETKSPGAKAQTINRMRKHEFNCKPKPANAAIAP